MMQLTKRALNVKPSATLAINAKAKEMRANGINVINFGAGEPDFPTPAYIREKAIEFTKQGNILYTPASGTLEIKKAIQDKFKKDNNLEYKTSQIIVSNGAKHSIHNVCQALLEEGDEAIIPAPYWVSYPELVKLSGATPKFIFGKEENGFKITPEQLEEAITEKTKLFILNSPSNPTGSMYTKEELEGLAKVIEKYDQLAVLSDEIYEKLVFDGNKHVSIASVSEKMKEKTIVINGVSKAFSMTGWRIGYAAGDEQVIKAMSSIQSHATSNPNTIAQVATVAALEGEGEDLTMMVKAFDERRKYIVKRLNDMKYISCVMPKGAFYVMPNISKLKKCVYEGKEIGSSTELCRILLESAKIACVPGIEFGGDDFIRLSYATSLENIKEGMDNLEAFVNTL